MTRAEHMAWCKQRALEYVDSGDLNEAFASMASDLGKHPETQNSQAFVGSVGMAMLLSGDLATPEKMRAYIEGFN